jgi:hypothetical protein
VSGARYAGGAQFTTPGGKEINRVGTGGAVAWPGGNAAAGKSNITQATGPSGTATRGGRGGVATGPGGTVARKSGVAVGPAGAAAGSAAAAVGPNGAIAGRAGAATGVAGTAVSGTRMAAAGSGTYYRTAAAVSGQSAYVRQ